MQERVKCSSCGAPMIWKVNPKTTKTIPMDEAVRTLAIDPEGRDWAYDVQTMAHIKGRLLQPGESVPLYMDKRTVYVSHFKTCPNASSHSRNK